MIAAIVLAAGQSTRMGCPKMILPWGQTTVIGQVVNTLATAGVGHIVAVVGGVHDEVETALQGLPVKLVYNPRYVEGDMLLSFQIGLSALEEQFEAALLALGDQPQVESQVVQDILTTYQMTHAPLVVPSYRMRRGHPWLLARSLWQAIFDMQPPSTLRDFLNTHASQIHYLPVDIGTVLQDLDTPEAYNRSRPE
jgi:molybdenum cofactor cytidylyltransferase